MQKATNCFEITQRGMLANKVEKKQGNGQTNKHANKQDANIDIT